MFYILIFLLGLSVGSFLNVVICRLETKEPIFLSRSHCPKCGALLKWSDLIPLVSFLIQKGKCRYCGKKISWQYPIVEITTGLLFLLIFNFQFFILRQGFDGQAIFNQFPIFQFLNLLFYFFIASVLIVIFVYDLKHYIIPDKIVYPAIIITLLNLGANLLRTEELSFQIYNFQFLITNQFSIFKYSIWSALGAAGFFFLDSFNIQRQRHGLRRC